MSGPILDRKCGSSSIRFALFDDGVNPLPRKPRWSGKVDGIGGANTAAQRVRAAQAAEVLTRVRLLPGIR